MTLGRRIFANLILLALTFAGVWFIWIRGKQLVLTVLLLFLAALIAGWLNPAPAAPARTRDPEDEDDPSSPGPGASLLGAVAGLACAWMAMRAALQDAWLPLGLWTVGGALAWRLAVPVTFPRLGRAVWVLAGLTALGLAAWFRFYRAGDIPEGLAGVDEPLIWWQARRFAGGLRLTYATEDNLSDGVIPLYLQALGIRVFGDSILAWRMEAILTGTAVTLLVYALAKEVAGRWAAWIAAACWGFSVWAVTYSRAQYFMVETYLIALSCILLCFWALRKGGGALWGLAGLFWAFSFNVYPAARILLAMVPWLLLLHAWLHPDSRRALVAAVWPLVLGLLVGLAPLVLWAWTDPLAFRIHYLNPFYAGNQAGDLQGGLLARINGVLSRCFDFFHHSFWLLTKRGSVNPYYFPYDYPLLQRGLLFFFLAGFAVCLARFRSSLHAFMLYWWMAAFVPAVASAPGTPTDRRLMMLLPVVLIMAGLGMGASIAALTRWTRGHARALLMLAVLAPVLGLMARQAWHDYFERNQNDYGLMAWNRVNGYRVHRAIVAERKKGPVVLVSTRRQNNDAWMQPLGDPYRAPEFPAFHPGLKVTWIQEREEYYRKEGLFGSLLWAAEQAVLPGPDGESPVPHDVLVVLAPFYFYLEPLLVGLGGERVAEIPLARASQGLLRGDVSLGYDGEWVARLVRIRGLSPETVAAARKGRLYRYELRTIVPPPPATRESLRQMSFFDSVEYRALMDDFIAKPNGWAWGEEQVSFEIPDPWFWQTHGNLPGHPQVPWRVRSSYELHIPEDGDYALGASHTGYVRLWLDGRKVFDRDSTHREQWDVQPAAPFTRDPDLLEYENERRGFVGPVLRLKKGVHRLDMEQAWLNIVPTFNMLLRLVWQRPGGEIETLPLDVARPWPGPLAPWR